MGARNSTARRDGDWPHDTGTLLPPLTWHYHGPPYKPTYLMSRIRNPNLAEGLHDSRDAYNGHRAIFVRFTHTNIETACALQRQIERDIRALIEDEQDYLSRLGAVQYDLQSPPSYHLVCPQNAVEQPMAKGWTVYKRKWLSDDLEHIKWRTSYLQDSINNIQKSLAKGFPADISQALRDTGSAPVDDELDVAILDLIVHAEDVFPRLQVFLDALPDRYGPSKTSVGNKCGEETREDRASTVTRIKARLAEEDARAQLVALRANQAEWDRKRICDIS